MAKDYENWKGVGDPDLIWREDHNGVMHAMDDYVWSPTGARFQIIFRIQKGKGGYELITNEHRPYSEPRVSTHESSDLLELKKKAAAISSRLGGFRGTV